MEKAKGTRQRDETDERQSCIIFKPPFNLFDTADVIPSLSGTTKSFFILRALRSRKKMSYDNFDIHGKVTSHSPG